MGLTTDGATPCSPQMVMAGQCVDALGYAGPDNVYDGNYNNIGEIDLNTVGGYLQAELDFDNFTLTSITAYDDLDRTLPSDADSSPAQLLETTFDVESETFSQELRASGATDTIDWLVGVYYLTEELKQDQTADVFRQLRAFTGGLSDPGGTVTGAPILFTRALNTQNTETFALFGQGSIDLSDKTTLTLGGRYTNENREFDAVGQLEDVNVFGPNPFIIYQANDLKNKDDAFSWRLALDHQVTDNALVYASVSRGFKSGGFNGGFLNLDPVISLRQLNPFGPEFLTAYEAGIKSDLFDNRLRLNASLFFNDFKDLQVFTFINTGNLPVQLLDNASGAEVKGFEFDLTARPTENLTLALSGAFTDSELTNFITTDSAQDFSGNKLAYTPDTSLTAIAKYDYPVDNLGTFSVQGSVAYKSSQFFSTENNPLIAEDGYTLGNARVQFEHESGKWFLAGYVKNIGDVDYRTTVFSLADFGLLQEIYGRPQTFGAELGVNF